jgi:hypothetical protein
MTVNFRNPELATKLEQWVSETGRPAEELVEKVMAGYFDELGQIGETINSRYDDTKGGTVKLIPGDEIEAYAVCLCL